MKTFSKAVDSKAVGSASTDEALALFDSLDTVDVNFMVGSWSGESFPTGHPLDGSLETYHWHGKRFDSAETVHPLVFKTTRGSTMSVNPVWMMPVVGWLDRVPLRQSKTAGDLFQQCIPLFATTHSCARLRMTQYRGKESATMIYDALPINDVFRKIDENTVLGIMDLKDMKQPFFFILHRE